MTKEVSFSSHGNVTVPLQRPTPSHLSPNAPRASRCGDDHVADRGRSGLTSREVVKCRVLPGNVTVPHRALLPDREPATAEAWLAGQPQIALVARDRGGGYALAAQKALPHAVQVADRWHLIENASRAFVDAVSKSNAPDPNGDRRDDHRSCSADRRRADPIRGLSAA